MREIEKQGSLYEVLGVARNAGLSEIQRAYRTLGSRHHPDRFLDEDKKQENGEIFRVILLPIV
ncbi:MAG: DnaJ-like protein xdj1 [Marteilia pararefringens]